MKKNNLLKDAILRIGEVSGIEGRTVFITLDKNKNASELFFDGAILKNIAVGSYVEIRKGFLSIIGKAEGEKLTEESVSIKNEKNQYQRIDRNKRTLTISLSGYINFEGKFIGGIKELPLIGNEAFILTESKIHKIHNLLKKESALKICIAKTEIEEVSINFPIDGLFNSHIAIFGNTGSGKSNTLAILYQEMIKSLKEKDNFKDNCKFFIFDFNGEYSNDNCITSDKKVYNLSTQNDTGDKIPMTFDELMDIETLSILLEATEKTQKPFLKRTLRFFKNATKKDDYTSYFRTIIENKIKDVLQMTNKDTAYKILDYLEEIISFFVDDETKQILRNDIEFHNQSNAFFKKGITPELENGHFVASKIEASYLVGAKLGDSLEVKTELLQMKAASFTLLQTIYKDETKVFEMKIKLAYITFEGRPQRLDSISKELILSLF